MTAVVASPTRYLHNWKYHITKTLASRILTSKNTLTLSRDESLFCFSFKGSRSTRRHANSKNSQLAEREVISLMGQLTLLSSDRLMTACNPFRLRQQHIFEAHDLEMHNSLHEIASVVRVREMSRRQFDFSVGKLACRQFNHEPFQRPYACTLVSHFPIFTVQCYASMVHAAVKCL